MNLISESKPTVSRLNPFKVKSWSRKEAGMEVKVEFWQDGPEAFEIATWKLGASVPVLYRFKSFQAADHQFSLWVELNKDEPEIMVKLQAEIEMLHSICASAQCWLDAAGFIATGENKIALQKNADAFREAYSKITS